MQRVGTLAMLIGFAVSLGACAAGTRTAQMGFLPNDEQLVTLTVTEDRKLIARECDGAMALGPILGCQVSRAVTMPDGQRIKTIKIIRFTDALPSAMAMEIDIHELCHAVASLQPLHDPCHIGNNGMLQGGSASLRR